MIGLLTAEQARRLDAHAAQELTLPSRVLMENAGLNATQWILQHFEAHLGRVLVVCGPGQNGGDGWVVARELHVLGHEPWVWSLEEPSRLKGDALENYQAVRALGLEIATGIDALERCLAHATLVVDALFGTGLCRPLEGTALKAVHAVNAQKLPTVALDLPSGIHADTAQVCGAAVHADVTITFGGHKRGLHQYPGVFHAGDVQCVAIGVPFTLAHYDVTCIDQDDVSLWMRPRNPNAHKGSEGHVFIIAGSPGKTGAALLTAQGAMRSGAGSVTIAPRPAAFGTLETRVLECMTLKVSNDGDEAIKELLEVATHVDAAVLGPGLGLDPDAQRLAHTLAMELPVPTVIDADALSAFAQAGLSALVQAAAPRVLTPHPGEAARLLGCTALDIQADRYQAALTLAKQAGHVVVLKGARSIIAAPDGNMRVCGAGTPAMATAGSGDVLAGIIAAQFKSLGNVWDAASLGTLLHALAGEYAAECDRGLLAHEIADAVPSVIAQSLQSMTA